MCFTVPMNPIFCPGSTRGFRILVAPAVLLFAASWSAVAATKWPTLELKADNTVIAQSCRVVIPPGSVLKDADGNGVMRQGLSGGFHRPLMLGAGFEGIAVASDRAKETSRVCGGT